MTPRTLTITSSIKLPHPNADYASIASSVTIGADLSEDDNVVACAKKLQAQADNLVEQHLESKRHRIAAAKPQAATEQKAADLAAKHGGR